MSDYFNLPEELIDSARVKLNSVISSKREWKTFQFLNASQEILDRYWTSRSIRARLEEILAKIARFPVVLVEPYENGALICSLTFVELTEGKRSKLATGLKPPVYLVFYPREDFIFSTKNSFNPWLKKVLLEFSGAIEVNPIPLQGPHIHSLREIFFNKKTRGIIRRQPVPCSNFLDVSNEETENRNQSSSIIDLDKESKLARTKQFQQYFDPSNDPQLEKISFKVSTTFSATDIAPSSAGLVVDMQIRLQSSNLSSLLQDCNNRGIFPNGIPPYLQNLYNYGRTEVTLKHGDRL